MEIECPSCGAKFSVRTRSETGTGTQRKLNRLSKNKMNICEVLVDLPRTAYNDIPIVAGVTVKELQGLLYKKKIARWRRGDKKNSTGGWNYHQVQAELSLLLGNKIVTMTTPEEDNFTGQLFEAKPTPRYYMTNEQKLRFRQKIKPNGGKLNAQDR